MKLLDGAWAVPGVRWTSLALMVLVFGELEQESVVTATSDVAEEAGCVRDLSTQLETGHTAHMGNLWNPMEMPAGERALPRGGPTPRVWGRGSECLDLEEECGVIANWWHPAGPHPTWADPPLCSGRCPRSWKPSCA